MWRFCSQTHVITTTFIIIGSGSHTSNKFVAAARSRNKNQQWR
jgi:hypothetical protein